MLRDILRRLGPIAWRDARIEELLAKVRAQQGRIEELREQRRAAPAPRPPARPAGRYRPTVPSWHARIMEQQRVQRAVNALPGSEQHPRRNLFRKLHNYELARSLGVATPQVLGVWPAVGDVDWDLLPERFVLKSNGGSTGRGVLPLERHGSGFRLVDGSRDYTAEEVVEHFEDAQGAARPPFFAESLLAGTDQALPDDVKVYAFYGEVAYVMLRRMPRHADLVSARVRMVSPTGEDLGLLTRSRTPDPDLPIPPQLPLMVDTAAALSLAVPLPYIRVDLYGSGPDGVVLGELTPLPGDSQTVTAEWDRRLGEMYDDAEARLQVDLANGRPYRVLHGEHARALTTPVPTSTQAPAVPGWGTTPPAESTQR